MFDAQFLLQAIIRLELSNGQSGYNGGHGGFSDDGFDKQNITFAGKNLTVRQILSKIAAANGNALWVVQFSASEKMSEYPFRAVITLHDEQTFPAFHWQFIPLTKL